MAESDEEYNETEGESLLYKKSESQIEADRRIKALYSLYPNLTDPLALVAMHVGRRFYEARTRCIQTGGKALDRGGYEVLSWSDSNEAEDAKRASGDADNDMFKFRYQSWHSGFSYTVLYDIDSDRISILKTLLHPVNPRLSYDADVLEGLFRNWHDLLVTCNNEARLDIDTIPEIQFSNS